LSDYNLSVSHCAIDSDSTEDFLTFGGSFMPQRIVHTKEGQQLEQLVHDFDFTNFYEIDMHWGCGSCPHLFFLSSKLVYVRELLSQCENYVGTDEFLIPNGVKKVVIAELEDEITEIVSIKLNGVEITSNEILKKGQMRAFPVSPCDQVEIVGQYVSQLQVNHTLPTGRVRNSLIHTFLLSYVGE
jgi:hypothetical protein